MNFKTQENQQHITQFIIDYIVDNTTQEDVAINENSNFISEHLLDSFATLSLIMTLESQFNVKLSLTELANEEMRIVNKLAANIAEKLT